MYIALGTVMSDTMTTLPLTTTLSWSLSSTPDPPDCVTGYMLSFNGNTFTMENTSVSPNELRDNGFPFCTNQALKISPIIPAIGDVESSSLSLQVRVEEGTNVLFSHYIACVMFVIILGFQSPQDVSVTNFRLHFDSTSLTLTFSFTLQWTLVRTL